MATRTSHSLKTQVPPALFPPGWLEKTSRDPGLATRELLYHTTQELDSAFERMRQHTFELRDKNVKQPAVLAGMQIKVGARGERFWCRVKWVRWDEALVVTVDNDLIRLPWKCGDEIVVQQDHVLEACDSTDMLTFAGLLAASGSASRAAVQWREMRVADGLSAMTKPGTVFVLPNMN